MVWKVVKSAQPPVRYRPNSDRRPDIVRESCVRVSPVSRAKYKHKYEYTNTNTSA